MTATAKTVRLVVALVVADIALFLISGIPALKDTHHGADAVIGQIVWVAFLLGVAALIATGGVWAARVVRARRASA